LVESLELFAKLGKLKVSFLGLAQIHNTIKKKLQHVFAKRKNMKGNSKSLLNLGIAQVPSCMLCFVVIAFLCKRLLQSLVAIEEA
jgi:hypothetical protein